MRYLTIHNLSYSLNALLHSLMESITTPYFSQTNAYNRLVALCISARWRTFYRFEQSISLASATKPNLTCRFIIRPVVELDERIAFDFFSSVMGQAAVGDLLEMLKLFRVGNAQKS